MAAAMPGPGIATPPSGCSGGFGQTRPPPKRAITDATATEKIVKVHEENKSVNGSLNVWPSCAGRAVGDRVTR